MRSQVTCKQGILAEVVFRFENVKRLIHIFEETRKKADERFQSVCNEAGSFENSVLKRML